MRASMSIVQQTKQAKHWRAAVMPPMLDDGIPWLSILITYTRNKHQRQLQCRIAFVGEFAGYDKVCQHAKLED